MSMRARLLIAALPLLTLAACADGGAGAPSMTRVTVAGPARADVNAGYVPGRLETPNVKLPSLREMQDLKARDKGLGVTSDGDRLRTPAMRDAALSYGARGGLAWASVQVNADLERHAGDLSKTWDFNRFLIRQPNGGVTLLPPVILESRDTYEQADAGRTLRVADRYYEIIEQARFAPVAPLWHTYLVRSYTPPEPPQDALLPKNDGERDLWKRFVAEGWAKGVEQSRDIFTSDLRRLERDFTGMIRYASLLEQGQVSAPVVASQNLGVTGTGTDMRENDQVMRITRDPRLNVQRPSEWTAPVSGLDPAAAATPPGQPRL